MLAGGWAPYLALLVMNFNFRIDVALLQWLRGAEEVGIYSLGVSVAEKIQYLPEALALLVLSQVATSDDADANRSTASALRNTLWFLAALAVLLGVAAGWLVPWVYGEAFAGSVLALRLLLPGMLGVSVYLLLHSDLTGRGRGQVTLGVFSLALLLNVALNLAWIPRWGAAGAALASTVSYNVGALGLVVYYRRTNQVGWRALFLPSAAEVRALLTTLRRAGRGEGVAGGAARLRGRGILLGPSRREERE
jgi:O-antigen/teichoic acid export membrane protein